VTASLPGYVFAGLGLAAVTTAVLAWLRSRGGSSERPPASTASMAPLADYEQLFTLSGIPMFVYDAQTLNFLAVNDAALRRYGYERSEFLEMGLGDIRLAEDVEAMKAIAAEARKSRSATLPGIWRHRRKDGALFHVRISAHDLPFDGRPARMVQVNDVTAEVALQAEREQMIAKLQHSREWLSTAINAGRIALWERDLVERTLVLGGRWADVLGTTAQAFGPVTEQSFIDLCHPDDLPRVTERFRAYLKDPAKPYFDEFRVKHTRDGWVWVLSRGRIAERTSDGLARRIAGTYVDISDLKAAQAAREQQQAAEQASSMKSEFLGRVSHELRTPLNAVIGFSQLMQLDETAPLTRQQAERVNHIEQAGQHLLGLITDLMDLSKIELGAVELQMGEVDVPGVLDESLAMVAVDARERGLTLVRDPDPALPRVAADPLRLKQCLINLLTNAVKYNRAQGTVRVGMRTVGGGEVELQVWNSGPGLTPQQLQRLYEPFNRLGRDGSHEAGSGIGLSITRQLVERMGGRIVATSVAGEWALFTVTLRAVAPRPAA
jgi:PAS domain S-box-containing protein